MTSQIAPGKTYRGPRRPWPGEGFTEFLEARGFASAKISLTSGPNSGWSWRTVDRWWRFRVRSRRHTHHTGERGQTGGGLRGVSPRIQGVLEAPLSRVRLDMDGSRLRRTPPLRVRVEKAHTYNEERSQFVRRQLINITTLSISRVVPRKTATAARAGRSRRANSSGVYGRPRPASSTSGRSGDGRKVGGRRLDSRRGHVLFRRPPPPDPTPRSTRNCPRRGCPFDRRRVAFRELIASPSASRVGGDSHLDRDVQIAPSGGQCGPAERSLAAKKARSGWMMLNSLRTTVHTPRKCPGRLARRAWHRVPSPPRR